MLRNRCLQRFITELLLICFHTMSLTPALAQPSPPLGKSITPTSPTPEALQFEHVWVSAFVDYGPSRGAVNRRPDTWVPIDPSFKLTLNRPGLNLPGAISFNENAVFDAAKLGATCTINAGQRLDPNGLGTGYNLYAEQLNNFIDGQGPDIAVADVLGRTQSIAQGSWSSEISAAHAGDYRQKGLGYLFVLSF